MKYLGLVLFCLLSEKGVNSKKKESAHKVSKYFPFRVDPFQKGLGVQECKQEVTKQLVLTKKHIMSAKVIINIFSSANIEDPNLLTVTVWKDL